MTPRYERSQERENGPYNFGASEKPIMREVDHDAELLRRAAEGVGVEIEMGAQRTWGVLHRRETGFPGPLEMALGRRYLPDYGEVGRPRASCSHRGLCGRDAAKCARHVDGHVRRSYGGNGGRSAMPELP